jgi:DNA invertase Pin-like site-specific DNA recombinase
MLASIVETERHMVRACTAEGRLRALAQGRPIGRPRKLGPAEREEILRARTAGTPLAPLAAQYGISISAVSRLCARSRDPSELPVRTRRAMRPLSRAAQHAATGGAD